MKDNIRHTLYESVHLYNILPLTSACNVSCMFCSHGQNPAGIEVFAIPPLSLEQAEELMIFLSPKRKIIIGESATRIIEGEPFCHPDCMEILKMLRDKFPSTPLQVTTNGTFLTYGVIEKLKKLQPLEINLSLNSSNIEMRRMLMRDSLAQQAVESVKHLSRSGIGFHGSIVPLPWVTGWHDIDETISFLEQNGAATVRVFQPGFTHYREKALQPPTGWEEELLSYLKDCRNGREIAITVEPPGLQDLYPLISGVVRGSTADQAGLEADQVILEINGHPPFSRVDAFYRLSKPGTYDILVRERNGREKKLNLKLGEKERSGLVMDYDLSPKTVWEVEKVIRKSKAKQVVILASEGGAALLAAGLKRSRGLGTKRIDPEVIAVPNRTFGGTIRSAGLLLVDDLRAALRERMRAKKGCDLAVLPAIAFDRRGRDLMGNSYLSLRDEFDLRLETV